MELLRYTLMIVIQATLSISPFRYLAIECPN
jgi:hypothetical protein